MARLVSVNDEPGQPGSNTVLIVLIVVVAVVVLALAFFWSSGYMGGPRLINMTPNNSTEMMTPGTQGAPGPAGAPGASGAGGAAGSAGAPAGTESTPAP
ncbi:MAG: hypothetical protein Q8K82_06195 [Gemmatimonadaceae bacterium]|nr:hypothetical protein [Gemmatimonadaceae bacterium]